MAKRPKKPKQGAPVTSWRKYDDRMKKFNSDKKAKESLIRKYQ